MSRTSSNQTDISINISATPFRDGLANVPTMRKEENLNKENLTGRGVFLNCI